MNVFAEKLSRKSSTIVSLSSTFGNRFANFANDGSPTTYHLTDVNENIVWFEVDLGKPYSINNFKLYYRKKGISNKKKIYTKQWRHYDGLLLWLKKTKSNVGFTENKIQSLKEMHRLRHFYMDASNLSASTSTTTQRTCCYRTLQNAQKSDLTFWTWHVNSEVRHFGDHVRPPWRSGCYLTLVLKMCIFWNTHFLILKSNQSRDQNFHMRSNNLMAGLLSLSTSASAL